MPEARDRLTRNEDLVDIYARRRRSIIGRGGVIFEDELEPTISTARVVGGGSGSGSGSGRVSYRTPARVIGRENVSPVGRGRGRGRGRARGRGGRTVLPSWYPRTPLRDITSIVRAIERTRARLREREGEHLESVVPQDPVVVDPSESTSGAQLEHNDSITTPRPTIRRSKYYPKSVGKVPKILRDITNQASTGDSDSLTPQRKLLNSIDTVEKAVKEELNKLKRTPGARKEERDKKVRNLMSMR